MPANNFLECSDYCSTASNVRTNKIIKEDLNKKLTNKTNNNINNGGSLNFLNDIINLTANSSDCELWPEFDEKIQQYLQECVAIAYENGQCRIFGASSTETITETPHSRLAQKNCVKVFFF